MISKEPRYYIIVHELTMSQCRSCAKHKECHPCYFYRIESDKHIDTFMCCKECLPLNTDKRDVEYKI